MQLFWLLMFLVLMLIVDVDCAIVSLYLKLLQAKKLFLTLGVISEVAETNICNDIFLYSSNFLKEL